MRNDRPPPVTWSPAQQRVYIRALTESFAFIDTEKIKDEIAQDVTSLFANHFLRNEPDIIWAIEQAVEQMMDYLEVIPWDELLDDRTEGNTQDFRRQVREERERAYSGRVRHVRHG